MTEWYILTGLIILVFLSISWLWIDAGADDSDIQKLEKRIDKLSKKITTRGEGDGKDKQV